jgi:hypothetical protein
MFELEMVEAVALFDYNGRTNQELSFRTNQIISISEKLDHQWWFGYLADQNQSGLIPDGYFKLKSSHRDSVPVPFSISSSSLHSNNFPTSINNRDHSTSSSIIDSTPGVIPTVEKCRLNTQQDTDTPDLVLNLPISNGFRTPSFDEHIPIVHSTIIIDLQPSSSVRKKISSVRSISISGSSKSTEV